MRSDHFDWLRCNDVQETMEQERRLAIDRRAQRRRYPPLPRRVAEHDACVHASPAVLEGQAC